MDTLDYVLAIGGVLVFIFTIVMDVLLVREWIKKRRDKQEPHETIREVARAFRPPRHRAQLAQPVYSPY